MSHEALLSPWLASVPLAASTVTGGTMPGIRAIEKADWDADRPGESEGWAYLRTCEIDPPQAMELAAVAVNDGHGFAAGACLFTLKYRLDTPFQDGVLGRVCAAIAARAPRLMEWRMLGVGSPFTERCPISLHPRVAPGARQPVAAALCQAVEAQARRQNASLIAFKDIAPPDLERFSPALSAAGYVAIESLPVAVLDLAGCRDLDAYLAHLSSATRKDLRRKLRRAGEVDVEWRSSIAGIEHEIAALYDSTRTRSHVRYGDFEELPGDYFPRIAAALGGQAVFACYRVDGVLAAFNLLLVEGDRVIDKFLGMAYPLGPDHDLYALSWMENVRFCQRIGRRYLQTGQTAYASKLRFGSTLEPRVHLVKHRNRVIHQAIRLAAPLLAFPRWDPDLRHARGRRRP
ncbi:GNAT family N-acetyltransferase [Roseixanthobacter glucoisosaccharinicivorans]|uniref:GNAT family N-acetyltransferase n=1 Tax=Roseixanthobacter glucoisosaccharinicivorans TaxID=3119923 RepID=UPI00372A5D58